MRHIVYGMFLWVMPATKSAKFGSKYLGEGSLGWDEISQVAKEGGWCTPPRRPVTFGIEGPPGSQNIEGCRNFL